MNHANSDFVRDDDGAQAYSEGQVLYLTYYFTHTVGGTPVMEVLKNVEGDNKFSTGPDVDISFVAGLISCEDEPVEVALQSANETAIAQAAYLAALAQEAALQSAKETAIAQAEYLAALQSANETSIAQAAEPATDAPTTNAGDPTVSDASSAESISVSLLFAVGAVAFGACL